MLNEIDSKKNGMHFYLSEVVHFRPFSFIDACFERFRNQIKAYAENHDLITVILFSRNLWVPFAAKFKKNAKTFIISKFN